MKLLNNYFKKVIVVFVVVILLTTYNMNVYSSIGSYQIKSQAITANTFYKKDLHSYCFTERQAIFDDSMAEILKSQAEYTKKALQELADYINNNSTSRTHPLSFKTKNYAKYDFSGFDN